ncbi:PAB1 binding protein [Cordyceps fumosorosea ARSEF 2679]|uniref:PAB1 binding protein n=1 Tax=Cordyceps fumosorosea (strain ARSEF 2679) TaxID=1081104 RepID=A0A162ME05_CORFA|nr:PAB1 binding protein [Cordyceps fumosorosea ARSEF 2679]OAA54890.1 PAB1 binding protein [Cordyceps fumosorosea ARSEF 2679]
MPPKKDAASSGGKGEGRGHNGNRPGFRTDTAISNRAAAGERVLQPWVPESTDGLDASLEGPTGSGAWDQFAANERLFGLKTDYDENIYTTAINKSHPQYRERIAAADRKAREIERSVPTTAHVAEERVMDFNGTSGGDENEEEKYSGVRRQDFPPLGSGRENRYTPPAKRAPAAQSNVKGAPVDPAIISSQIKAPPKKQTPVPSDQSRAQPSIPPKNETATQQHLSKAVNSQAIQEKPTGSPIAQPKDTKTSETKMAEGPSAATYTAAIAPKVASGAAEKTSQPSATLTVERDVLNSFKTFATQQRINAEKVRNSKAKADKEVKLTELRKFATNFKLSTPVPNDLVSIIAKDPVKQKEIQARAIKNAEEVARSKAVSSSKSSPASGKDTPPKSSEQGTTMPPVTDPRNSRAPAGPHTASPAGAANRHTGPRQPYPQQYHGQGYRNNRNGPHNMPTQQTGSLAQRLRNVEQQKYSQPPAVQQPSASQDTRAPPTGPAGTNDANFNRRHSALPGHMSVKLNPNSHEFRPSPFAPSFNPINQVSASSSPRTAANTVTDSSAAAAVTGQLIRRKTRAVDAKKCCILSHIKKIAPPQGRNWDDNGGLRPSYDTLPTWRQLRDDEKADSTMHLTYKARLERNPFSEASMATPNPSPAMPHQHQLPFHLQHGSHNMGQRQSPAMPPMQMHTPHHGPGPHGQYGTDDHRMMHSNSQQSFASPRMTQMPMVYNTPGQVVYNQPVYMGGGAPQMGQYRSFSNNHPQYAPPQGPMMMQPHFMHGPQGMVGGPQLMYPGAHGQFMPPTGPPQPGPVANGYPSPGRPSAPAMAHQGSQQGQPMYSMSPSVQYNQPVYGPGQGGGQ